MPIPRIKLFLAPLFLLTGLLLGGCAEDKEVVDEHADWTVEQFYRQAKQELMDRLDEKAAKLFEKLGAR